MGKKEMYSLFENRYEALKTALAGDDPEKIRELALEVHALVHPAEVSGRSEKTIADYVLDYMMAGNQNVPVPRQVWETDLHYAGTDTVPLCWQFWHTYRIEDLVSNILMANRDQIFDPDWQKRIGACITDTGNALEPEEAAEFAKQINVEALREYMIAVGKNTRSIMEKLTLDEIRSMVPEEWVMRILEVGGVTTDFRSVWLLVFWGRLTRGGMILTPMTYHHMMHLPACIDHLSIDCAG
ncbi:MAG: hypothetical protein J5898_05955 [Lachnospiraceae bacterium]|nr:hypothetical protein [Lachnospiraceae bacterium]MBP5222804.1 hypothetical protein [Lachnospiraceae bacterium]